DDGVAFTWGDPRCTEYGSTVPVRVTLDAPPAAAASVVTAVKRDADVVLEISGVRAATARVHRDPTKATLGSTALAPDVATAAGAATFGDDGAVRAAAPYYYSVRGLSPCSLTPGP